MVLGEARRDGADVGGVVERLAFLERAAASVARADPLVDREVAVDRVGGRVGTDERGAAADLFVDMHVAEELQPDEVVRGVICASRICGVVVGRFGAAEAPVVGGGLDTEHVGEKARQHAVLLAKRGSVQHEPAVRAPVRVGDGDEVGAAAKAVDQVRPLLVDQADVRADPRIGLAVRLRHHLVEDLDLAPPRPLRHEAVGHAAHVAHRGLHQVGPLGVGVLVDHVARADRRRVDLGHRARPRHAVGHLGDVPRACVARALPEEHR
eukprot:scaffold142094_cov289-Phaeocystis_antarctica.AAC.1